MNKDEFWKALKEPTDKGCWNCKHDMMLPFSPCSECLLPPDKDGGNNAISMKGWEYDG